MNAIDADKRIALGKISLAAEFFVDDLMNHWFLGNEDDLQEYADWLEPPYSSVAPTPSKLALRGRQKKCLKTLYSNGCGFVRLDSTVCLIAKILLGVRSVGKYQLGFHYSNLALMRFSVLDGSD